MQWLSNLIKEYCNLRIESQLSLWFKVSNYKNRVFVRREVGEKTMNDLAIKDITSSTNALKLVESRVKVLSNNELNDGITSLKIHISLVSERKDFLIIYASFLAISVLFFKLAELDYLIYISLLAAFLVVSERSRVSSREYALNELLTFLERISDKRKVI